LFVFFGALHLRNSFRISTYEKTRGGGSYG
jgi:hypothetical protein